MDQSTFVVLGVMGFLALLNLIQALVIAYRGNRIRTLSDQLDQIRYIANSSQNLIGSNYSIRRYRDDWDTSPADPAFSGDRRWANQGSRFMSLEGLVFTAFWFIILMLMFFGQH